MREDLPQIAGLSRVGLFHLFQQQPGVVLGLEVSFVALHQIVGVDRVT